MKQMKTKAKSKSTAIFAVVAILLLAIGFALGMSNDAKILTASAITGNSVADIQAKLTKFSETLSENEKLLNDLNASDLKEQEMQSEIDILKDQNKELGKAGLDLINVLNQELAKMQAQQSQSCSVSGRSSGSSSGSGNTCTLSASDCPSYATFDASSCSCISVPPRRPDHSRDPL